MKQKCPPLQVLDPTTMEAMVPPVPEAPGDDVPGRSPELVAALTAARERGRTRAAEILNGEDMLSAELLARRLGTSLQAVNTMRQNGQLLALDGARLGYRFPVWQLDPDDKPRPELPVLHKLLGGPWAVYRFLVQPRLELNGLTGREALARGFSNKALDAAESVGRGDFS